MKILFLSDNFPPESNAPAIRTYEHTREWVKAGHEVIVVTCAPNFPRGKVYEGYRNRLFQREEMDGISVVRVWTYIAANEGSLKRIIDYVSFMLSSVAACLFLRRPDVVIGTSLVQILFTMAAATILHAVTNQSVDAVLGLILMVGGVIGAQFGAQMGQKLRGEQLRALLALVVLAVGVRFAVDIVIEPEELFSLSPVAEARK